MKDNIESKKRQAVTQPLLMRNNVAIPVPIVPYRQCNSASDSDSNL